MRQWPLADTLDVPRLVALTVLSVGGAAMALVVVHGSWERGERPGARAQMALFNLATVCTVLLGEATLDLALLAITLVGPWLVPPRFWHTRWDATSACRTTSGSLGWSAHSSPPAADSEAAVETDATVREAAYAFDAEDDAADAAALRRLVGGR